MSGPGAYLGDGVYVRLDERNGNLILALGMGPHDAAIVLEPDVYAALEMFVVAQMKRLKEELRKEGH